MDVNNDLNNINSITQPVGLIQVYDRINKKKLQNTKNSQINTNTTITDTSKSNNNTTIKHYPNITLSDKIKEEISELKQLTKETNNIFKDKPELDTKSQTIIHINKPSKNILQQQNADEILIKQEFEEKLSYLLKKLDIIYDITDNK